MPAKRSDALPGDKMLTIFKKITLDGRQHFQSDLARDLECSSQTVARLIDKIEPHLGKDAYIERGLKGRRRYYQLCSTSDKRSLGFSFEELHFLTTCRDLAASSLPKSIINRIDDTLTHLALMLGERASYGATIGFRSKGHIDYAPHFETITILRTAISKRQVCRVVYTANGRKQSSIYRYAPGRVLVMGGTLYVQGYRLEEGSLLQGRPTTFSLHRISEAEPTGEYFNFNADEGDSHSFGLDWHEPKRMHVHIAPKAADYVRDRTWSDDQTIEDHTDDSLTLSITTTSETELNAWVMSFGKLARIVDRAS